MHCIRCNVRTTSVIVGFRRGEGAPAPPAGALARGVPAHAEGARGRALARRRVHVARHARVACGRSRLYGYTCSTLGSLLYAHMYSVVLLECRPSELLGELLIPPLGRRPPQDGANARVRARTPRAVRIFTNLSLLAFYNS